MREKFPNLYKYFKNNIIKHAIINSFILSSFELIIGSLVCFIFFPKYIIVNIVVFMLLFIFIFYMQYIKNKPNDKNFAKMLDSLGLSQRVITMYEYKDDDSLIAKIQRENAIQHINNISGKDLKVAVKLSILILFVLMLILSAGSITVAALANEGVINDGQQIILDNVPGLKHEYELFYDVNGAGYIEGDFFQIVAEGEDASEVWAIPDDDWFFIEWSDGLKDPYRHDLNVQSNIAVFAIFGEIDLEGADPDFELDPELDIDQPIDDIDKLPQGNELGKGDPSNGAGGRYEDNNQVIDGETYYGDNVWRNAYEDAVEEIRTGSQQAPSELICKYFEIIQK